MHEGVARSNTKKAAPIKRLLQKRQQHSNQHMRKQCEKVVSRTLLSTLEDPMSKDLERDKKWSQKRVLTKPVVLVIFINVSKRALCRKEKQLILFSLWQLLQEIKKLQSRMTAEIIDRFSKRKKEPTKGNPLTTRGMLTPLYTSYRTAHIRILK